MGALLYTSMVDIRLWVYCHMHRRSSILNESAYFCVPKDGRERCSSVLDTYFAMFHTQFVAAEIQQMRLSCIYNSRSMLRDYRNQPHVFAPLTSFHLLKALLSML